MDHSFLGLGEESLFDLFSPWRECFKDLSGNRANVLSSTYRVTGDRLSSLL